MTSVDLARALLNASADADGASARRIAAALVLLHVVDDDLDISLEEAPDALRDLFLAEHDAEG